MKVWKHFHGGASAPSAKQLWSCVTFSACHLFFAIFFGDKERIYIRCMFGKICVPVPGVLPGVLCARWMGGVSTVRSVSSFVGRTIAYQSDS